MTTQPWTPERALAMFRSWCDISVTHREHCERWGGFDNLDDFARIAVGGLESATAEIERQRARADATEIGAGLLRDKLQVEIAEVERLKAELAKAQQQQPEPVAVPSDAEITGAIGWVATSEGKMTAHALMLIAHRIRVKP